MVQNYFISIVRYISRNKAFTIINVSGLTIGIAACMLIAQFALHEFSYDKFLKNHDRIYRVQLDRYNKGERTTRWAAGCLGIGPDLKANFPEVERFVRLTKSNALLAHGDLFFKEENVYYSSADFFRIFSIPLIEGVDSLVLKQPNTMVISRSLAKKYFGEVNPVGKTMRNNGRVEYLITGLFEDIPAKSHLKIDALLSFSTYAVLVGRASEEELTEWQWDGFLTYIQLNKNTNPQELAVKLPAFVEERQGEELKRYEAGMVFHLQPISDIHLDSNFIGEFKPNGDRDTANFLSIVAVLIIIIAWINYVNLATAKSIERAREVGVRKVMGSLRAQLIHQFLFESLILNLIAVTVAIAMVVLLTPWFSGLTGRPLDNLLFNEPVFWGLMLLLILGGALISGLYPSFVLSGFRPVEVLKGRFRNSGQGVLLRKGMVVVQFVTSITLIVGTFTVYQQITFMRSHRLGVDIAQTLILRTPNITDSTYQSKYEVFRERLLQYPEINSVTASTAVPGRSPDWNAGGIRRLSQREEDANQYRVIAMDKNFIPAYGLEVIAGRSFSGDSKGEEGSVILNETGARLMGFTNPEEAINDRINFWGDTCRIIGIVKDYRQESIKKAPEPLIFRYSPAPGGYYSIKIHGSDIRNSMANLELQWKEFFPGNPFNFFFLDDYYNQQYQADQQFGTVFGLFSALAIFIACLGLLGLSSLTVLQRTKEIGVRKVLGASVNSILGLVSREYMVLMVWAIFCCNAIVVLDDDHLAGELCEPDSTILVDFRDPKPGGYVDSPADGQSTHDKGCPHKSCNILTV
ncbi:ABC transporter permease [Oscillatoria amoena NRMC-F 0135]|nr:ABC transporter permease [Oscillatoria amoena NRMC-F 0135]